MENQKYTHKNSVNQKEIEKFSKMANEWWDQNGKFKILHRFNHARVEFIDNILNQYLSDKEQSERTILDVGCGGGLLSESFAKKNYQVTGIDAEEKTIQQAQIHANQNNLDIEYLNTSAEAFFDETKKQFNIIFAMEVIEHVDNPEEFIKTLYTLLKPNGLIFFSTINKNAKSIFLAKFMAEYVLGWVPKGTHDFNKFITPAYLNSCLEKNNLDLQEIQGIKFNPISQNWYLHKNTSVNYICFAKKK